MDALGTTIFALAFLAVGVQFVILRHFVVILRSEETEVWRDLGEPHLFRNNTPQNAVALMGFLIRRRYRNLESPRAVAAGRAVLISQALGAIPLLCWFAWVATRVT